MLAAYLLFARGAAGHDRSVVVVQNGTCMAHDALRAAVAERGVAIVDEAKVRLRVLIAARSDGAMDVAIAGTAGSELAERHFVATSCAEAIDALGLVIALSAEDVETSDPAPVVPSPQEITHSEDVPKTPVATPDARAAPTALTLSGGAFGSTFGQRQLGIRIGVGLAWPRTVLPWIEASAARTLPHTIDGDGGGADPTWTTGRLAAAPFAIALGRNMQVSAFGTLEVGALGVTGSGVTHVDTRTRAWFAVGAGARGRWTLGDSFFAGLDVGAVVPLVRDDFVIVNGGSAYRVPAVGAETAISLGVTFP